MSKNARSLFNSGLRQLAATWQQARSRGFRSGIALAVLGGMLLGGGTIASVLAAVQQELSSDVIEALKFGERKNVLLIIAVDEDGNMQPFCGLYNGKPCQPEPYGEIPDANLKKEVFGIIAVGNPKVCWKTSSGDKECVTY